MEPALCQLYRHTFVPYTPYQSGGRMLMSFVQCSHIAAAMQTYGYLPGRRALPLAGSLLIVGPADSSRLSSAG